MTTELKESSGIKFSLSFLIQILTFIVLSVWGYSQLDSRIAFVENSSGSNAINIDEILKEIKESQDKPISSDIFQNTSLRFVEEMLAQHQAEIIRLQDKVYQLNRMLSMRR